jgi:hypothetical protein
MGQTRRPKTYRKNGDTREKSGAGAVPTSANVHRRVLCVMYYSF